MAFEKLRDLNRESVGLERQEAFFDGGQVFPVVGCESPSHQCDRNHRNQYESRRDWVGKGRSEARQESHGSRKNYTMVRTLRT
jgi:hypothetical protein